MLWLTRKEYSMYITYTKDLNSQTYFDALSIRKEVFVKEQQVPLDIEVESEDRCCHFVLYDDTKKAVATCRLLEKSNEQIKLQRMAVLKEARKFGYGLKLVLETENYAKEEQYKEIVLGAQIKALGFYEKLGYKPFGKQFLEAGILHCMMSKQLL